MSQTTNNFRSSVLNNTSEKYKSLLAGSVSLLDTRRTDIESNADYTRNYSVYTNRLQKEVSEVNTGLEKIISKYRTYEQAISAMNQDTEDGYSTASAVFHIYGTYRQSVQNLAFCQQRLREIDEEKAEKKRLADEHALLMEKQERLKERENSYQYALSLMRLDEKESYKKAHSIFSEMNPYKNSEKLQKLCIKRYNQIVKRERKAKKLAIKQERKANELAKKQEEEVKKKQNIVENKPREHKPLSDRAVISIHCLIWFAIPTIVMLIINSNAFWAAIGTSGFATIIGILVSFLNIVCVLVIIAAVIGWIIGMIRG